MKKILITLIAITISLGAFAQEADTMFIHKGQYVHEFATAEIDSIIFYRASGDWQAPPRDTVFIQGDTVFVRDTIRILEPVFMTYCNPGEPLWGASLGVVSFYTDRVWTIEGNGIAQRWSDAVTATACQKTTFSGGTTAPNPSFNTDCRDNPNFPGDLFSWCAIVRFQGQLCPYPWRVPSADDFFNLDIALGGTGGFSGIGNATHLARYINEWGGQFSGRALAGGGLSGQNAWGEYWSQTEILGIGDRLINARALTFRNDSPGDAAAHNSVTPQASVGKSSGFALRCVQNVQQNQ